MRIPNATYRLQLNKDFRFDDARKLVPFLYAAGISHVYASPIFQARKGSMHGYDVADPSRVNPELGKSEDFEALISALKDRGMALLADIVPNHMAASPENPWWMDVLENGSASPYSAYFDVEWGHTTPSMQNKIYLPVLGEPYGTALESQKLHLAIDELGLYLTYYSARFPIDPGSYHHVLSHRIPELLSSVRPDAASLREYGLLIEAAEAIPERTAAEWEIIELRRQQSPVLKRRLWDVYSQHPEIRAFVDENIRIFNGTLGDPTSFNLLDDLLNAQPYDLSWWQVAREKINYRRFFDVSELIGLRTQDPQVFEAIHEFIFRLIDERKIAGVRIDHVDGLYDPLAYLARLQARTSAIAREPFYIVVEKILSGDERLHDEWPVAGTTGYEFLGVTNNLFVRAEGLPELQAFYARFSGVEQPFAEIAYEQKKNVIGLLFEGEMRNLAFHLGQLAEEDRHARDLSPEELRAALIEITACLPVYRTYTRDIGVGSHDRAYIEDALRNARRRNPSINPASFDFLQRVLLLNVPTPEVTLRFVMRWQQLTGPIMAKGVEDTTLYIYNRLISMNEVGASPEPVSTEQFHTFCSDRRAHWQATMSAGSTHDTKRSEDVRARINLLSEIPDVWSRYAARWSRWNTEKRSNVNGVPVPDANTEYLLYQTLLGAWPLDAGDVPAFRERLKSYLRKAMREAKVHSSWFKPGEEYESGVLKFADAILEETADNRFLPHFLALQSRIAFYGSINSLAQTLLRITAPGVPDFYQNTFCWDFSLVDPDNRRPVNVARRIADVGLFREWEVAATPPLIDSLLENWRDGRIKMYLIYRSLQFRAGHADLFSNGEYLPLQGQDLATEHTVSFARRRNGSWAITLVPRFIMNFSSLEKFPLKRRLWKDSAITLPENAPDAWTNLFTAERVSTARVNGAKVLYVSDVLNTFPVALLHSDAN